MGGELGRRVGGVALIAPLPSITTTTTTSASPATSAARIPLGQGSKEVLQLALKGQLVAGQAQGNTQLEHVLHEPLLLNDPFPLLPQLYFSILHLIRVLLRAILR